MADRSGDADRADDEHDERAGDEFGAQREPVETVEEEFGEGLVLGFECGGFRRGACGGFGFRLGFVRGFSGFSGGLFGFRGLRGFSGFSGFSGWLAGLGTLRRGLRCRIGGGTGRGATANGSIRSRLAWRTRTVRTGLIVRAFLHAWRMRFLLGRGHERGSRIM